MATTKAFRETFSFGHKSLTHWFPSHMARSMKRMQANMKKVDCVIEVHDARIPFSGRNPVFRENFQVRPHLLVLNKTDLVDLSRKQQEQMTQLLNKEGVESVFFTNCSQQHSSSVKRVIPKAVELITKANRYTRRDAEEYSIMVIGIPNVGKSSLINAIRRIYVKRGKATPVGRNPGVTKSVMNKIMVKCKAYRQHYMYRYLQTNVRENDGSNDEPPDEAKWRKLVSANPLVYVLDTPGVMTPFLRDVEVGMKIALVGTLRDHMVGHEQLTDYLLFTLNKHKVFHYVAQYELKEPSDNIFDVLAQIAKSDGKFGNFRSVTGEVEVGLNLHAAATRFLNDFRDGKLGKVCLD